MGKNPGELTGYAETVDFHEEPTLATSHLPDKEETDRSPAKPGSEAFLPPRHYQKWIIVVVYLLVEAQTKAIANSPPQSGPILLFNVKLGLAKATGKPIQEEQSG